MTQKIDLNLLCCPPSSDGFRYWNATPVNTTLFIQCPSSFRGVKYNSNENASRYCTLKGIWDRTNYEPCFLKQELLDQYLLIILWTTGYTLSMITLLLSLFIFRYFRSLHCLRNDIHVNLIISFIIRVFFWYMMIFPQLIRLRWPKMIIYWNTILSVFATTSNFFWMLVEGLYLLIAIAWTFRLDSFRIWHYCVIGWGIPFLLTSIKVTIDLCDSDNSTMKLWSFSENIAKINFIVIHIPTLVSIVVNIFVTAFVIYTLVKKLKETKNVTRRQVNRFSIFSLEYRKAIKAVVVLIPLLGLSHVLAMFPTESLGSNRYYTIFTAILTSTQGFFVSLIYCFLNYEVRKVLKAKMNTFRGYHRTRSRHTITDNDDRNQIRTYFECKSRHFPLIKRSDFKETFLRDKPKTSINDNNGKT